MKTQNKINEALIIAMQALPKFDHDPDHARDPQTYRVCLSADVTAYCRELGLLKATQFVNFTLQGPAHDKWATLRPAVYEEGQPVPLARAPLMQERPYAPVPVADELRKQFLAITDPRHPLVRHVSAPIKIQPFWTIGSGPLR